MPQPTMDEVMAQAAKVARLLWVYPQEERERRFAQALGDTIATLGDNPMAQELSRAALAMQLERLDRTAGKAKYRGGRGWSKLSQVLFRDRAAPLFCNMSCLARDVKAALEGIGHAAAFC